MSKANLATLHHAGFIESMERLPVSKVPDWTYEIKLNGYRLEVVRRVRHDDSSQSKGRNSQVEASCLRDQS